MSKLVQYTKGGVSYASRATGVDLEKYLVWGGIALGVYFVAWPMLKGLFYIKEAADAVIDSARSAVASGLYDWFGPEEKFGPELAFTVKFPNGQYHSVPSDRVSDQGVFRNTSLSPNYAGDGKTYQIVVDKRARGNKVAYPL